MTNPLHKAVVAKQRTTLGKWPVWRQIGMPISTMCHNWLEAAIGAQVLTVKRTVVINALVRKINHAP